MAKKEASSGNVSEETRVKQSKKSETRTRDKGKFATERADPPTAKKTQPVRKSAKSTSSSSVVSKIDLKEVARLVSQLSDVRTQGNISLFNV